jgi:predicted aspartyl protease
MAIRAAVRTFSIVGMILLLAGNIIAADIQAVLDKHLKAIGGREVIAAIKSVAAYSTIEYMGLAGSTVSIVKFPGKYYTRLNLGGITEKKGFDGLTAWTTDANGITRRDIAEELKPMINELFVASYSYLLSGRIQGRIEYRGDTLIDESIYHHLAMYPEGGDSLSVFINAANGRLEYRSEIITGIKMITSYTDFRMVAGVETPFASDAVTPGAPYDITGWVDSVLVNPVLPDSLFLMPGISAVDVYFPEGVDSVAVPMEVKSNGLYLEVMINGQGPFYFLLDSGSASTVLSKSLADKLGIDVIGNIPARGVGGFGEMGFGQIDSLSIGSLSWHLNRIMVYDFSSFTGSRLGILDGILGYDFFARFPMLIDFGDDNIVLFSPFRSDLPRLDESVGADIYLQIPVIEASLNGYPVRFALDLGAEMGVVLQGHSRWYREMADEFDRIAAETEIQGVGGILTVKTASLDSLRIGNIRIDNPKVMVTAADDPAAIPFPDYIEGFLGIEILKEFNLLINYPEGKISFERR